MKQCCFYCFIMDRSLISAVLPGNEALIFLQVESSQDVPAVKLPK